MLAGSAGRFSLPLEMSPRLVTIVNSDEDILLEGKIPLNIFMFRGRVEIREVDREEFMQRNKTRVKSQNTLRGPSRLALLDASVT